MSTIKTPHISNLEHIKSSTDFFSKKKLQIFFLANEICIYFYKIISQISRSNYLDKIFDVIKKNFDVSLYKKNNGEKNLLR